MAQLNPTQRIVDVISAIDKGSYQLPNIQRDFVWDQKQILLLLDSIMCNYPIGALMVWSPQGVIRSRPFLKAFTSGYRAYSDLPSPGESEGYMVLDGQQRLQALYLSFLGTYDGERVYLKIDGPPEVTEDGLHYHFEFLTAQEAARDPAYVHINELRKIDVENINEFVERRLRNKDDEGRKRSVRVISRFVNRVVVQNTLLFQEVDEKLEYNDVLEVFERANRGGTPLSKSDLLFSTLKLNMPDMEERFGGLVDRLNHGGRHDFDTDFVIKTAFVVFGKRAKYDYRKLDDELFMKQLGSDFDKLEQVITSLSVWLEQEAKIKASRFLRSKLALIPIIDYLILSGKLLGPDEGIESLSIRQYLYMAVFLRLYSHGADSALDQIHDILVNSHTAQPGSFPLREIGEFIARRKGSYNFSDQFLSDLDLILNIIDDGVVELPTLRAWSLDRDHIFPRHVLSKLNIAENVDNIGNLRLLAKARNISKSDTMPDGETEFFGKDDQNLRPLYDAACSNLSQGSFDRFVEYRRNLMREHVVKFLGLKDAKE